MNLAGSLTKIPNTAHVMAQKIAKAPKAPSTAIPSVYRRYQSRKIKPLIRLKGRPQKLNLPKGLSNPYTET